LLLCRAAPRTALPLMMRDGAVELPNCDAEVRQRAAERYGVAQVLQPRFGDAGVLRSPAPLPVLRKSSAGREPLRRASRARHRLHRHPLIPAAPLRRGCGADLPTTARCRPAAASGAPSAGAGAADKRFFVTSLGGSPPTQGAPRRQTPGQGAPTPARHACLVGRPGRAPSSRENGSGGITPEGYYYPLHSPPAARAPRAARPASGHRPAPPGGCFPPAGRPARAVGRRRNRVSAELPQELVVYLHCPVRPPSVFTLAPLHWAPPPRPLARCRCPVRARKQRSRSRRDRCQACRRRRGPPWKAEVWGWMPSTSEICP
jgi:hypothetical protein